MKQELILENDPHARIFTILFNEQELTWQNIIYDLVRQEGMNPWDIDVSLIAKKFMERIRALKEVDFRATGKMVLAAAILVKMKSTRFIEEDMAVFDQIMSDREEGLYLDEEPLLQDATDFPLYPRTPQPRKRKVSVFDLVKALELALKVNARRKPLPVKSAPPVIPIMNIDLEGMMGQLYIRIETHFKKNPQKLTFAMLVPGESKMDKVLTFVPLLHLDMQRKIDLMQQQHFGEIQINLAKKIAA